MPHVDELYMMNFLFEFRKNPNARSIAQFSGNCTTGVTPTTRVPLYKSKNWLKLKSPLPVDLDTLDPEPATWEPLNDMGASTLVVHQPATGRKVGIAARIAPDPTIPPPFNPQNSKLQATVCFGRPNYYGRNIASPFNEAGEVRTTFIFQKTPTPTDLSTMLAPNRSYVHPTTGIAEYAWYFPIGIVDLWPPPNNNNEAHRYEFAFGIRVQHGADILDFSMDPEMDVSL